MRADLTAPTESPQWVPRAAARAGATAAQASVVPADLIAWRARPSAGEIVRTPRVELWWHDDQACGEPIAMVGGFTAGHFVLDRARPHFPDYRLVTWEPRGLWRSECPDPRSAPYGTEVWAEDLEALLDSKGVPRAHIWAQGFGSYIGLAFAALRPDRVGALITYTDVWAGGRAKGYAMVWEVYRAIVRNFGTCGFGARVLANVFHMSRVPWFGAWEAQNIEEVHHSETVEATVGYGLLHADVRSLLSSVRAPVLVLQGDRRWDGGKFESTDDVSLSLLQEMLPGLEVASVDGAHPGYALIQKPYECSVKVRDFVSRHPLSS